MRPVRRPGARRRGAARRGLSHAGLRGRRGGVRRGPPAGPGPRRRALDGREFQESTLARPVPPAFLDLVVEESLEVPARVWRAAFAGFLEDDVVADLGRIAAPTLVVRGTRDAFCSRRDRDALLAAIPGSRILVYEGAGHALHWEEPARFARDVVAFARELAGSDRPLRDAPSGRRAVLLLTGMGVAGRRAARAPAGLEGGHA